MKALPKVGRLLRVLVLCAVSMNLLLIWSAWQNGSTQGVLELDYLTLTMKSGFSLLTSVAAWLLWRWKTNWVQFLHIRAALGDEYTKPVMSAFTMLLALTAMLGSLLLAINLADTVAFMFGDRLWGFSYPRRELPIVVRFFLTHHFVPIWILMIAASRFIVYSARVEALRDEHLDRKRIIVDKCESYCRESRNSKTRESRAQLGLEALPALVALDPHVAKRATGLEIYFEAVQRCAALVDAVQHIAAVQTERSKTHHSNRVIELLDTREITDEDLILVGLMDPESPRKTLTTATLRGRYVGAATSAEPAPSTDPDPSPPPAEVAKPIARPGPQTEVHGFALDGTLAYVGEGITAVSFSSKPEPALIDPTLRIDATNPARSGRGMPERPSYSELTPKQRAAFLEWLALGRSAPSIYIGYVLLFFYGLERRLGADLELCADSAQTWITARAEVARLRELYGSNTSFSNHATSFLAWMDFQLAANGHPADADIQRQVILGELAHAARPVSGKLVFEWALSCTRFQLKMPAQRCPEEFRDLFQLRYEQEHGAGLVPASTTARIKGKHKTASPSFSKPITFELDLPDVERDKLFVTRIDELLARCSEELAPYARQTQNGTSLSALGLLPREIARTRGGQAAQDLVRECEQLLDQSDRGHIEASTLRGFFPPTKSLRWSKAEAVRMAQTLDRFGFGIEPDVRFAAPTPRGESTFELFRLPDNPPLSPSDEYVSAIALVQLTAAVVAADGELLSAEEARFEARIEETLSLGEAERIRLRAHLRWRTRERPNLAGLKTRLMKLTAAQRQETARFLLTIAAADGHVSTSELTVLSEAYSLLGLDPKQVHSDMHSLALRQDDDHSPREQTKELELDEAVVARKRRESLAVSRVLADIFDDEPEVQVQPAGEQLSPDAVLGLDKSHAALFHAMRVRDSWTRSEFETLSSGLGLLPDGALETLNENAFEQFDSPFTEGDDPIELIHETVQEFLK